MSRTRKGEAEIKIQTLEADTWDHKLSKRNRETQRDKDKAKETKRTIDRDNTHRSTSTDKDKGHTGQKQMKKKARQD